MPALPARQWQLQHDGRAIPVNAMAAETVPGMVETRPRQQRRYPELPEGVTELAIASWIRAVWISRDSQRDQVRFSQRGAEQASAYTRTWTREQVAAAKQWIADLGWIEVVHPQGNYVITERGEAAFARIWEFDDLRLVAADDYVPASPPPRRVYIGDD